MSIHFLSLRDIYLAVTLFMIPELAAQGTQQRETPGKGNRLSSGLQHVTLMAWSHSANGGFASALEEPPVTASTLSCTISAAISLGDMELMSTCHDCLAPDCRRPMQSLRLSRTTLAQMTRLLLPQVDRVSQCAALLIRQEAGNTSLRQTEIKMGAIGVWMIGTWVGIRIFIARARLRLKGRAGFGGTSILVGKASDHGGTSTFKMEGADLHPPQLEHREPGTSK